MTRKNMKKAAAKKTAKARGSGKTPAKRAAKVEPVTVAAVGDEKTKRVRNYRRHAKTEISKSFTKICKKLVEKAEGGSIGHTKLLFDVGGVKDDVKNSKAASGPSLGELLLKEIEKQRQEETAETSAG